MRSNLLLAFACALAIAAAAQPTWRFHLAFEDGTGARDTVWFVWDTTATQGWNLGDVDYQLGEGACTMDLDAFNVWLMNWDGDSTKTNAFPYSLFPWMGGGVVEIRAFNYQYPVTIRWDRSLLHASFLPNPDTINYAALGGNYFWWMGNMDFPEPAFSILEEDSVVVVEDYGDILFPTHLTITHLVQTIGIHEDRSAQLYIRQWNGQLEVRLSGQTSGQLEVVDVMGRLIHGPHSFSNVAMVPIQSWPDGPYFVRLRSTSNYIHNGKFIKSGP